MKKLVLFLFLLSFIGCNEGAGKEKNVIKNEAKREIKKELTVIINFKTNKEDDFKLMLNNVIVDEFQKKNIHVIEKVMPTTITESLTAKFGENNISNTLIISLGKKQVKDVEISDLTFIYGKNTITISKEKEFNKYLKFNKFIEPNWLNNILKTKKVDNKYNPTIVVKRNLLNRLIKSN